MLSKKKVILTTCVAVSLFIIGLLLYITLFSDYARQKRHDMEQLSSTEYNGIFCSMYSIENFAQKDFVTYRGVNTLKLENTLRNTSDMAKYLSAAFASGNTISNIYLGLDPDRMWNSSLKIQRFWNNSVTEDIIAYASAHPDVTFEVLLPAPSLEYWLSESAKDTEEILHSYQSLICALEPYNNIIIYFMGHEQWLTANPANYTNSFTTSELVSQKMFLYTFCDHEYQINAGNVTAQLNILSALIDKERTAPTEYPNLASWDVVFFGDSIIDNYVGSFSVPGVVNGLSEARTYNCAKGGIPASVDPNSPLSFPSSVDYFIAQEASQIPVDGSFRTSLEEYATADHTGQNLCFVLNFGLNDYFVGHPVANAEDPYDDTCYAGALRVGISKLQSAYPDATILLMTPNFISAFSNGTEVMSEKGGMLTEYADAALQVADEMNVLYMNNYTDLGIDANNAWTYLVDHVHLNETGRFLLGEYIIYKIGSIE